MAARVVAAVLALLATAGCGASTQHQSHHSTARHVTVRLHKLAGLGPVLVDSAGRALYMFPPDHRRRVTCTGPCAGTWPPLMLPAGATPAAGPGVRAGLLGSDPDPSGGRVVTYNGWPLYRYVADLTSTEAVGQALDVNGGFWYVLRASGTPVTPAGTRPPT